MHATNRTKGRSRHAGRSNVIVTGLLAAILVCLIILIGVLTRSRTCGPVPLESTSKEGRPRKINDPDRIKGALLKGRTYEVVLKGGFDGQVVDKEWGVKQTVSMAYQAEMNVERTIEENDGEVIVELRKFVTSRNVKLLADVDSVKVELGPRGTLVLGAIAYIAPRVTQVLATAKPIVEAILQPASQRAVTGKVTKAFGHVDSLSGKSVRITYRDGLGVESIQPVGCDLSASERAFIMKTAVLSDCYLMPNLKIAPGEPWNVDGSQLANFLDPSLRAFPAGQIEIVREKDDVHKGDEQYAVLKIQRGVVRLNATDASTNRVGEFTPKGRLNFNLTQGFVSDADMTGRFDIEEVSTDHILFETRFETHPIMQIQYTCKIR